MSRGQGGRRPPRQHLGVPASRSAGARRDPEPTLVSRDRRPVDVSYLVARGTLLNGRRGNVLIADRRGDVPAGATPARRHAGLPNVAPGRVAGVPGVPRWCPMSGGFACSGWVLRPQPWLDRSRRDGAAEADQHPGQQAPTASSIPQASTICSVDTVKFSQQRQ